MNTTQQQPKYQSGPMTFKRNFSDSFTYYWVIAMYALSIYEFITFIRYGAYNATSSLLASIWLCIIGWCFSSKAGAQEQKNYTIEFGVNGTLSNGFSMCYKGHPVKVSYTLDGQGRFVGGKNLKDSIFFADGTKISGHQKKCIANYLVRYFSE